jgi:ferric-dicitrate binding protein FerR (iron transport regulator)
MSPPRYARLAGTMLSRVGSGMPPPPDPGERAEAIGAIASAIATARRRRRVRQWAAGCAAAAAIVLTAFGGYRFAAHRAPVGLPGAATASEGQIVAHPVSGGSSVVVSGAQAQLDDGRLLGPGSRVVTPANGRAMLSFSTGSTVLLREGTDMTVAAEGAIQTLHLDAGFIELHVAKLAPDHRFLVATPDSEVEVRGTRFSVSIVPADPRCGNGARTRVAVTEGVVVVRHAGVEDRVALGDQWPSGCQRAVASVANAQTPMNTPREVAPLSAPTLAEQNDLFAAAASAKRRGDTRGAVAALDRFLGSYPSSPLVESAAAERMRILHAVARGRAQAAARDYLSRYPNGFAHSEAEAIAAETP